MADQHDALARVIYAEGAYCGECEYLGWDSCSQCRQCCLGYAAAVVEFLTSDEAVGRGYQTLMGESKGHPVARFHAALLAAVGGSDE